jgi:tRNA A37 threonylcarbamoyladenosine biosynthesis protein TsaE
MHYDLYRLKTEKDIQQLGVFEQNVNNIKVIEWAEIIKDKPDDRLEIYMFYEEEENMRKIDFKGFGRWKEFNAI